MEQEISLKNINRIAIPAIFAGVIEPFISISDTFVAGHLPNSELNIGIVGLVGGFISALVWILAQTKTSISTFISQAFGANQLERTRSLFSQLFYFNLILSLTLASITFFFAPQIFSLQNAQGALLEWATDFYRIRVWGFPCTLLTFTIFGAFRGMQNTSWAMWTSIVGGVLNIGLNYLFAFQLGWGLEGIAYASLIAQFVMLLIALVFLFHKTIYRLRIYLRPNPQFIPLLTMTFNLFLRASFLNLCFWVSNAFATDYGEIPLATHSIMMQIWLFTVFFLDGYSNAGNAIAGKLYGAKEYSIIQTLSNKLIRILLIVSVLLMLVMALNYFNIVKIFTKSESVEQTFYKYYWILILIQPVNAMTFLFDGLFKGMGKAVLLRNVLFVASIIIFIPFIYILNEYFHNLYAIWIALFIWMLARSFPLFYQLKIKEAR